MEHVALLRREHFLETLGIDDLGALIGGHLTQVADGSLHHRAALWGQLAEPRCQLARIGFLVWSEAVPGLHAIQHALLLLRRQAVEALQALLQLLLLLRRKPVVLRIVAQGFLLFFDRQIAILAEPGSGGRRSRHFVTLGSRGLARCGRLRSWSAVGLRWAWDVIVPRPLRISRNALGRGLVRRRCSAVNIFAGRGLWLITRRLLILRGRARLRRLTITRRRARARVGVVLWWRLVWVRSGVVLGGGLRSLVVMVLTES